MVKTVKTEHQVEVTLRPYELMLILSPDLREPEVQKKLKDIVETIEKAGGKITNEDFWGKKELAFRLKKFNEGFYMVYNLELPNIFLGEFRQYLRIEKDVLRSMIISLPKDYTYIKYDLEVPTEEKPKRERSKFVSVKKKVVAEEEARPEEKKKISRKEETAEEKTEEKAEITRKAPAEKEHEGMGESELDRKLGELLGGEDLKL